MFLEINVTISSLHDGILIAPDEILLDTQMRPILRVLAKNGKVHDISHLATFEVDNPSVLKFHDNFVWLANKEGFYNADS